MATTNERDPLNARTLPPHPVELPDGSHDWVNAQAEEPPAPVVLRGAAAARYWRHRRPDHYRGVRQRVTALVKRRRHDAG